MVTVPIYTGYDRSPSSMASGIFIGGATVGPGVTGFAFRAVPKPGYAFVEWKELTGQDKYKESFATWASESDSKTYTAVFKKVDFELDLAVSGCGWVDSNKKKKYFAEDEQVRLTATAAGCGCPDTDGCCSRFKGWTGNALAKASDGHWKLITSRKDDGTPEFGPNVTILMWEEVTTATAVFSEAAKVTEEGAFSEFLFRSCACDTGGNCKAREKTDDCGQKLAIVCKDVWIMCFKGRAISNCEYSYGSNDWRYSMTGTDATRFMRLRHMNLDLDQFRAFEGRLKLVEYNCITCEYTRWDEYECEFQPTDANEAVAMFEGVDGTKPTQQEYASFNVTCQDCDIDVPCVEDPTQ